MWARKDMERRLVATVASIQGKQFELERHIEVWISASRPTCDYIVRGQEVNKDREAHREKSSGTSPIIQDTGAGCTE